MRLLSSPEFFRHFSDDEFMDFFPMIHDIGDEEFVLFPDVHDVSDSGFFLHEDFDKFKVLCSEKLFFIHVVTSAFEFDVFMKKPLMSS